MARLDNKLIGLFDFRFGLGKLALEQVDFQPNSSFHAELTAAIAEAKTKRSEEELASLPSQIEAIIKAHTSVNGDSNTGITSKIILGKELPSFAFALVTHNHPFISSTLKNYLNSQHGINLIRDSKDGIIKGMVNIKTGQVSGVWSEQMVYITLPTDLILSKSFKAEWLSAMLIHEVGHFFTYCEYITRVVTTNQVLSGMSKALDGSDTVQEREAVLVEVKNALKLSDLDIEQLAKCTDKKVAEIVVLTNVVKETSSELGSDIYDMNQAEQLADQYANRYGAGMDLVMAIDYCQKQRRTPARRSFGSFLLVEAVKILLALSVIGSWLAVAMVVVDSQLVETGGNKYDTLKRRFLRIKNDIIENLKDKNLLPEKQKQLTADLVVIDEIAKEYNENRQFFAVLADWISPTSRKERNIYLLHKELEDIASNPLFAKASELKNMPV